MKNFFKLLSAGTLLAILLSQTGWALTDVYYDEREDWIIDSFHSDIQIYENGNVDITETIVADFTNEAHRGIERVLPYKYENGYNTHVYFEKAVNEKDEPWNVDTFRENGWLYIQMTTKDDSQMNWPTTFILNYRAENAIIFTDDTQDEFFWNVNGTEGIVPVKKATASVKLPKKINEKDTNLKCITGKYGETNFDCKWKQESDGQTILFSANNLLKIHEGLNIVIGMPKGTVFPPTLIKKANWFIRESWGFFLIPLTLIIATTLWFKRGRDDQSISDTIMPHYKPPEGLLPSETGTLIDEKLDPRDITATIIDFAIKGYIKIHETEEKKLFGKGKNFKLELLKPYETSKEYERIILGGIFLTNKTGEKVNISYLKNTFYVHLEKIQESIMNQLVTDGYFPHNPSTIRNIYSSIGGLIAFLSFYIPAFASMDIFIGTFVSGVIIMIMAPTMARKTKKGTETYYQLKGLYEYIDTAEKDRMKFQEDASILFEKLLPYAMAFGLAKKWAEAFGDILKQPPNWYTGYGTDSYFTMAYLADGLSNFNNQTVSNFVSRPGSSGGSGAWSGGSGFGGGGFSGGGFGGGGVRGL